MTATTEQRATAKQLARESASKWGGSWTAYVLPGGAPAVRGGYSAPAPTGATLVGHWSSPSADTLEWHPAEGEADTITSAKSRMQTFMERLKAAGGSYGRIAWAAKTDPGQRYDNVFCHPVYGAADDEGRHPPAGSVILVEWEDGLGVYFSSESNDYESDMAEIMRRGSRQGGRGRLARMISIYQGHDNVASDPDWSGPVWDYWANNPDVTYGEMRDMLDELDRGEAVKIGGGPAGCFTIQYAG